LYVERDRHTSWRPLKQNDRTQVSEIRNKDAGHAEAAGNAAHLTV